MPFKLSTCGAIGFYALLLLISFPAGALQASSELDTRDDSAEEIKKPERVYSPQPRYTPSARRARIEGTVSLQVIVDRNGAVTEAKVLAGLPMGLSETALETIKKWRFKPATLKGEPIDVYLNLTAHFSLR